MDRLHGLLIRLRSFVQRKTAEHNLDDEMRFHLELEIEAGVRSGLTPDEARRRALVRFGGVERHKDDARDTRGFIWLEEARADLRHAWRLLFAHPVFALTVILTLGLGIGADTAIFSVINAVLLRLSPFAEPDRLVMIWETDRGSGTRHEPASWPDIADFRARSRTVSSIGTMLAQDFTLGETNEPIRVAGVAVTPNLPQLLGVKALAGHLFASTDGLSGNQPVALLGESLWRTRFNADPSIIGRTITLNERPVLIIGVLPAEADLGVRQVHERADYGPQFSGDHVDVWLASEPTADVYPRDTHPFLTLGRLAPAVHVSAAQAEMASIASDLERSYGVNAKRGVNVESYDAVVFGPTRRALFILLGAVTLMLLVTCANIANLLLARMSTRAQEVAVRVALGAAHGRIMRQFLTESLLFVAIGTIAGVLLARIGLNAIVALAPGNIPRLSTATVDGQVLAYAAAIAALVAIVFGVMPALQTRRLDIQQILKSDGARSGGGGRSARRVRSALVVSEVALAVILVIGASLLLKSFWLLQRVNPGFDATQVLEASYQLPQQRYGDIPTINRFNSRFLSAVRALPGVRVAALAGDSPLDPGFTNSFGIVGREAESATFPEIRMRFITPGYLETLNIPLISGRKFEAGDDPRAPLVILINRAAATRYFPTTNPIGHEIRFWGRPHRIIGVVGDEKFKGLSEPTEPAVYQAVSQVAQSGTTLLVRTDGADPLRLVTAIRAALRDIDPRIALYDVQPLEQKLSASISKPRFDAALLALFAAIAMLLAVIGVYGVLSYSVAERASEMGVRMALGASRWTVMRGVLNTGLRLTGVGIAFGLAAAFIASSLLSPLVFGVTTTDPATFAAVTIIVVLTAIAASLFPALRATRADPMSALRADSVHR